ncbi:MHS family proline/betaine transporter-like MFS transporter [Kineosphaera limosa]|uniref:Putative proline/betaine transporter n=1 Tax=Kineosphaera limosa NBRC 100340 TaxID=1184609 RepID=K6WFJ4_9MICO|nr:MFS transporter [Kineosphaera limosa]NYE00141.1 MHS family proline/betaine transporter-like MFS transporter [Kineosphaera limosa]GAB98070.1 proline/betaine transporter [Kineosphaera limosa NBRC 100340]
MAAYPADKTPDIPADADKATLRRAIGASAIGNAVEWFDYGVFAYGAVIISRVLFPEEATNAIIFTLLAFAVSFVMRPVGGMVWGPLGDKVGRKKVLALTIMLMAAATFCIGLIPSYAAIGIAAPVLLYLLRMVQGFSTGGEYGGAATFMAEYAPDKKRGFYGSFLEFGTLAGFNGGALLMLTLTWNLSEAQMLDWGWRIPFLIAGPLGIVGLYLRAKMEDTPVFRELEAMTETTDERVMDKFKDLFTTYLPIMLRLGALVIALNVINYTLLSYMPTYLQTTIDLADSHALIIPIVGQFAMMAVLPFVGALSDRVGRKPLWIGSLVAFIVLAVPMYHFMAQGFVQAMIAFTILGLLYTPQLATISATFPAMFPAHVRYAGLAMGYNISTSLFGGTAPLVNEGLIDATGNTMWPAYYMVGACVVGLIGAVTMIETKGVSVRGTQIPGTGPIPIISGADAERR